MNILIRILEVVAGIGGTILIGCYLFYVVSLFFAGDYFGVFIVVGMGMIFVVGSLMGLLEIRSDRQKEKKVDSWQ